jgi:hypothetical protein
MVEAASTSETSANVYQTTRDKIPEDSHFLYYGVCSININFNLIGFNCLTINYNITF